MAVKELDVAVVILNYNGKHFLEKFLPDVVRHSKPYRTVVIDNASTDDSVAYLQQYFPTLECVLLPENYGFAGGYQRGLHDIKADAFVLLNSDVEVTPNWLNPMVDRLLSREGIVAAVQPKIRSYSDKNSFEYAGAAGGYLDVMGYPYCKGRIFDEVELDQNQYNEPSEIFWASGACMLVLSEVYWRAGGLDERFFAHMEEIDLCWRIHLLGYEIWYEPESIVYHVGGGTLPQGSPRKLFLNYRNNLLMIAKNTPDIYFPFILLGRLCLDGISAIPHLINKRFDLVKSIFKAHMSFYTHIPQILNDREKFTDVQRDRAFDKVSGISVVWSFFGEKKRWFTSLSERVRGIPKLLK